MAPTSNGPQSGPTPIALDSAPEIIRRYCERAIPTSGPVPRAVRLTQIGDMWRAPGTRPMHFTATEDIAVDDVAFAWTARLSVARILSLRIDDGFDGEHGWMRGHLAGIPVIDRSDPGVDVGAAIRYLAELPWAPHALLANRRIAWTQTGPRSVEASTPVGGVRAAVTFEFDACGDIVRVGTKARPRYGGDPAPWGGCFGDHRVLGGIRIPTAARVHWLRPEGAFTYRDGAVTAVELVAREVSPA